MKFTTLLLAFLILLPSATAKAHNDTAVVSRDSVMAVLNAAKDSDPDALNHLGIWYYEGANVERDYTIAARFFAKAASLGHADAAGHLGLCYRLGHGVEADSIRAMHLFDSAISAGNSQVFSSLKAEADTGDTFATAAVAHFLDEGIGTARDYALAAHYYSQLAHKKGGGDTTTVRQTGVAYFNALDYKNAIEWLRKGALCSDSTCEYLYGLMLVEGLGCSADCTSGFVFALNAAKDGNIDAMRLVARLYREGKGISASAAQADCWLRKATYLGDHEAIFDYALIAIKKNEIIEAAYLLSWLQARNSFVPQVKALFDEKNDDNILSTPFGHYTLAISAIAAGDFKAAKKEIKALKKAKIAIADVLEAQILLSPANEKRDIAKAVKQLAKTAEKNAYAAYTLAQLYRRGTDGLAPNREKAIKYQAMVAEAGFIFADDDLYTGCIDANEASPAKNASSMQYPKSLDTYLCATK